MRLSLYTDLSLRLLMYLARAEQGVWIRTSEVARVFRISVHHLQKAAQGLVRSGHVQAMQGRTGGVRLSVEPASLRIGAIVAQLEGIGGLIDCQGSGCPIAGRCALKRALNAAERSFVNELNEYTLADVVAGQTGKAMLGFMEIQAPVAR